MNAWATTGWDGSDAGKGDAGRLIEMLIEADRCIERAQRAFKRVHGLSTLVMVEAFGVDPLQPEDLAECPGLREKRRLVDKAPETHEVAHGARFAVVAQNAAQADHRGPFRAGLAAS